MIHKSNTKIRTTGDLSGKKVALAKNVYYSQELLNSLKNITPVYVDNIEEALYSVANQKVDASFDFSTNSYFLQKKYQLNNIKFIALKNLDSSNESIAVRKDWPILVNILQKGLNAIHKEENHEINQLWNPPFERTAVPTISTTVGYSFALIAFALFFWLLRTQRHNHRLLSSQQQLLISNAALTDENEKLDHQISQDYEKIQGSEEQYRSLVENLRDEYFFYNYDLEGNFIYLSPSITSVLGYSIQQFSKHYKSYLTNLPENAKIEEYIQRTLKGEQVPAYQIEILDSKKAKHILEIQQNPVYNQHNECIGLKGTANLF